MYQQSGQSQASGREFLVYTDQHGREYEGWGDVKAKLHPTTPLKPLFDAPWKMIDQKYMTFSVRKPGEFRIDYEAMLAENVAAHEARRNLILQVADHFNVKGFDPDTMEPDAQMKRELGQGPLPSDPIEAAMAGNGYVLGTRPFDPNRPGDGKLKAAIELWNARPRPVRDVSQYADSEYADEVVEEEKPRNKGGRPTNAERAARLATAEA